MLSFSPGIIILIHIRYMDNYFTNPHQITVVCTFNLELLRQSYVSLPFYISSQLTTCPHFHFLWPMEAVNGNKKLM